ncbi:bifunctional aspartate aminotransferase and L-aspartate beta-decarboxylase [Clostridium saccharobutylicum]|uniref:Aminotransferase n=1 Tax=Clostridium saccharobutylicum DSM 13864 TaxID=1345695 RepID=U5MP85_CLOSA|nr:aspartate 4-decarboxylase [Clostridium saccharobutylicum]AGX42609.1 asD: bifunctional aspartate aminotransferase and L-aspartate beta-decarboxylase [Clostridium saccharobutylicum DSM 13864]AQR89897.1 bifunctional aspartate aminotransferase and L-aspartate beta-decarboxylase [Clostridium saccharobutylicum]AQR99801.1 bifunctional aspartate aminotransferase and L-aspartate beta-decarboxylase [Clostridium saccharobutylicum]AQS09529.1 bifunctional aspartate aminotransferase and L-aspartate beta-d
MLFIDIRNVQREEIENIYGKISPFEFKDKLIKLAEGQRVKSAHTLLDAGRGNPNWTAATPREAFFAFGIFAVEETRRTWNDGDLAGMPRKDGIAERLYDYLESHKEMPGVTLIKDIIDYGIKREGFDPDKWVFELTDAIIGDNYPVPDRMLTHIERIVHEYLVQELCYNKPPVGRFNIFAVEGATAAMCYVFDSLIANELLARGDKIALMVPVFTPYLEIPHLPRYNFEVVHINAAELTEDGTHTWQYPESEINKLKDSSIKALFVVNPSNPPSVAMKPECVQKLVDIVQNDNPDLMIISDDVYSTFVNNFRSLMADLPYNTIGVYSFSKYFGVTGWRLGTIVLYEKNVFDKLLKELQEDKKVELRQRYGALSTSPDEISFIDRIVADSRQVALNHTAGLSTPQQVQMAFFCAFALLDKENKYKNQTKEICRRRQKLLFDGLGLDLRKDPYDAAYYTEFDLLEWATCYYGKEFGEYLQKQYKPVDILYRLAEESSIVLLSGGGFQGPEWSIRISLANLKDDAYSKIGEALHKILEEYVESWKQLN